MVKNRYKNGPKKVQQIINDSKTVRKMVQNWLKLSKKGSTVHKWFKYGSDLIKKGPKKGCSMVQKWPKNGWKK